MGHDVAQIIQSSQMGQNAIGRSVVFTFCGPAGLIEGGSNQKITLIVDIDSLSKV